MGAKKGRHLTKEEAVKRQQKLHENAEKNKDAVDDAMSKEEKDAQTLMDLFSKFDQDANGVIQEDEFAEMLGCLNPGLFTREACQKMFCAADKNQDDKVGYKEFVDWLLKRDSEPKCDS